MSISYPLVIDNEIEISMIPLDVTYQGFYSIHKLGDIDLFLHVKHWYFSLRIGIYSLYEYIANYVHSALYIYINTTMGKDINISTYPTGFSL